MELETELSLKNRMLPTSRIRPARRAAGAAKVIICIIINSRAVGLFSACIIIKRTQ